MRARKVVPLGLELVVILGAARLACSIREDRLRLNPPKPDAVRPHRGPRGFGGLADELAKDGRSPTVTALRA